MIKFYANIFSGEGKNANYISSKSRNQLIETVAETFQPYIVDKVKQAHFFVILADETIDASKTARLFFCLRYILDGVIREHFFSFSEMQEFSGFGAALQI